MPKIVDHQQRRREISSIAIDLIARGGIEAVTIREIAQASAYSKGVVEHYFENKEEIISAALHLANERFQQRVDSMTASLSGLAALRKRLEATLPMDSAVSDEWKVRLIFWGIAAVDDRFRKEQGARFNKAVEYFEDDIKDAVKAGEVSSDVNPLVLARRLVNMATGISTASLYNPRQHGNAFLKAEIDSLISQLT